MELDEYRYRQNSVVTRKIVNHSNAIGDNSGLENGKLKFVAKNKL